jgi:alpha-amylase
MNMRPNKHNQTNIVLFFELHRPKLLNKLRFLDIGRRHDCFNTTQERTIINMMAEECYLPVNNLLLTLIKKDPRIQLTFSLSGIMIEQLEAYAPEVLKTFKQLAETGATEFLSETHYHSLAFMLAGKEFERQIEKHSEKLYEHFGARPSVFRNTGIAYNEEIGRRVSALGYSGILTDGVRPILAGRSPNYLYEHPTHDYLRLLFSNIELSDELASRFTRTTHDSPPVGCTPDPDSIRKEGELVTLGINYRSLWQPAKEAKRNLNVLEDTLLFYVKSKTHQMAMASRAIVSQKVHSEISIPPDKSELSDWLGNEMQTEAFEALLRLESQINSATDEASFEKWRMFQTSDYFTYMFTDHNKNENINSRSGQYATPYEAFINFMNTISEFTEYVRVRKLRNNSKVIAIKEKSFGEKSLT